MFNTLRDLIYYSWNCEQNWPIFSHDHSVFSFASLFICSNVKLRIVLLMYLKRNNISDYNCLSNSEQFYIICIEYLSRNQVI